MLRRIEVIGAVAVGGALGALGRHFAVNVLGCLLIGALAVLVGVVLTRAVFVGAAARSRRRS